MVEKPSKLQPVLLGGLVLGLGSVIPFVSIGNLCCCGWAIVGGAFAAYLLVKRSPVLPITSSEGAGAGALAGMVGAFIYLLIGVPLMLLQGTNTAAQIQERFVNLPDPETRAIAIQITEAMQRHPVAIAFGVWLIFTIVAIGMAALGGVIGVAMFEKRKGQSPPPAPYSPAGSLPAYGVADNFVTPAPPSQPPAGDGVEPP